MASYIIECPKCGTMNSASTSFFAKKVIHCITCGQAIDTKASRITSKACPHCGKVFAYDQASSRKKKCPACGQAFDAVQAATAEYKMVKLTCPQCSADIEVDKTKATASCPLCNCRIDVQKELAKAEQVKRGGISTIRYEGDNSVFVWKHPIEDFNYGSQLIVHESQEAVFFLNGQALDTFEKGQHTLETENLPILKNAYKMPSTNGSMFHAEVYFINKAVHMAMKWGTDTRVRFIDPMTGIPLDIGACGEMNLQVCDSRKLLTKLVGTTNGLTNKDILSEVHDATGSVARTLDSYFRAPLMTEVKAHLATIIRMQEINILQIDEKMSEISEALRFRISPKFEEYGIEISNFYVTRILLPEDDKNFQRIRELMAQSYLGVRSEVVKTNVAAASAQRQILEEQTRAQLQMIRAQGDAEAQKARGFADADIMRAKGYNQKDVMDTDVQKAYASGIGKMGSSGSSGNIATDLVGAVAGVKLAGNMMSQMEQFQIPGVNQPVKKADTWTCSCGEVNTGKFCAECGKKKPEIWTCRVCGTAGNKGKCCTECGSKKPE